MTRFCDANVFPNQCLRWEILRKSIGLLLEAKLASGRARVWPAEKPRLTVHWASAQMSAEALVLPEAKPVGLVWASAEKVLDDLRLVPERVLLVVLAGESSESDAMAWTSAVGSMASVLALEPKDDLMAE